MEEEEENDKEQRNRYTNMYESACIYVCVCASVVRRGAKKNVSTQLYKIFGTELIGCLLNGLKLLLG